jgi:hypothetical protein
VHEAIWSLGPPVPVKLGAGLEISAHRLGADRVMLSVFWSISGEMKKVLSVHVTSQPELGDPEFYEYVDGTVGLLSWRRGEWEDIILSGEAEARSASDLLSVLKT